MKYRTDKHTYDLLRALSRSLFLPFALSLLFLSLMCVRARVRALSTPPFPYLSLSLSSTNSEILDAYLSQKHSGIHK